MIRREIPWNILLVIALASTLFLLIPCIGYFLFPLALLYLLAYVAGLELWPPALLVALISTFTSVLVWQLLRFILEKAVA